MSENLKKDILKTISEKKNNNKERESDTSSQKSSFRPPRISRYDLTEGALPSQKSDSEH